MIKVSKKIKITNGTAPYVLSVDTSGSYRITQESSNVFNIDFEYDGEVDTPVVTVFDTNGCLSSTTLSLDNPCDKFYVSDIKKEGNSYSVSSYNHSATYVWYYDKNIFDAVVSNNSIQLIQKRSSSEQSKVTTVVTSEYGCTVEKEYEVTPSSIHAADYTYKVYADENGKLKTTIDVSELVTSTNDVDWSTLEFQDKLQPLTILKDSNEVTFTLNRSSQMSVVYRVKDVNGVWSNYATITLTVEAFSGVLIENHTFYFTGTTISKKLDIFSGVTGLKIGGFRTTATNPSIAQDGTIYGIANALNIVNFQVTGLDTRSNKTKIFNIVFIREVPTFNTVDDSVTINCSNLTYSLTSMNSSINRIISVPTPLTKVNDTSVKIPDGTSSSTYTIRVADDNGTEADLSLKVCNGCVKNISTTICEPKINLYSLLPDPEPNGTWSVDVVAPLPSKYDADIDIVTNGTYTYTYSVPKTGCPAKKTVINVTKSAVTEAPQNTCALAKVVTVTTGQKTTQTASVSSSCSSRTTFSGKSGNVGSHAYDRWYKVTNPSSEIAVLTVKVNGIKYPILQLWSSCSTVSSSDSTRGANSSSIIKALSTNETIYIQVLTNYTGDYTIDFELD